MLRYDDDDIHPVDRYESARKLDITAAFWQRWSARRALPGPLPRHGQALGPGAQAAHPCGDRRDHRRADDLAARDHRRVRNWDYRFVWLRDAAFTLAALDAVGHQREADAFMRFLKKVCRHEGGGHLQIMYGIDGRRDLVERQLDHLAGYRGSRPVRVGNGAVGQLQLDVYGEVLETADIWRRNHEMTEGTWRVLRGLVDWVSKNWHLPDSSIWEVRGEVRHYVFSKVMSWVALDRGVRMAEELALEGDTAAWRIARDALHAEIMERGWSERHQSLLQAYDDDALDAAALAIPMVRFLPWNHPRVTARCGPSRGSSPARTASWSIATATRTVWRARKGRSRSAPSGWPRRWRMIGERERAERVFRRMLRHANHVGLYSEEIDPATGRVPGQLSRRPSPISR